MTQLETEVQEYFSSVSCMSRTFVAIENYIQESYGEKWDELTEEERDAIFDDHVIPDAVADVYRDTIPENLPEVFPKLKVPCGEKIIVEESGRTWVDEHSGPFSWANRSQQDLRLFGAEDEVQEKKPVRPPRRHRTSDNNKEEKSQGNSLGKPLGNPQPEMTAADEIFQKFGIQFGTDQDDDEEEETEDSSGPLLPNTDAKTDSSYVNTEMLPKSEIDHMTSDMGHVTITTGQSKGEADFLGETYVAPELKHDETNDETDDNTPVFGATTTESTTDYEPCPDFSVESTEVKVEVNDQVIDMQPISIPYPEFLEAEEQDKDLAADDAKTGFDFLDNW